MKLINENEKKGLIYILNTSFSNKIRITDFDSYIIGKWCKVNNIDEKELDIGPGMFFHIEPDDLHNISADIFIQKRKQYLAEHSMNYILINSLYDIHYNVKHALHFIDKLCNPKKHYKKDYNIHIYVLSLDPYREATDYLYRSITEYSLMEHHGLSYLYTPRESHKKNRYLLNYLCELRQGDEPVSYTELAQASDINAETIRTYVNRHVKQGIIKGKKGRKLTNDEIDNIFLYKNLNENI